MTLIFESVRVATGSDEEGMLVFNGGKRLVAVLTHLGDQYGGVSGHWYLEVGFGRLDGPSHPTFADLGAAEEWLSRRMGGQR
ncbi:hypothetical protein FHR70_002021 [Microvirga lupini]|uniref:Uncharacterized protein n=1 Tax=Microvirga lupini TaxID=420324 RepID=A0A7W4YVZ1_9HYPH|nr:hypothetical protein [Microvirga lupini]MBB3018967.1 hypothetical protein [Microvirga lupini]